MRIDRVATLGLFHPAARVLRGGGGAQAILMYHSVSETPEAGVPAYFRLNTSPRQFSLQMDVLADSDWEVVPLADLLAPQTAPGHAGQRRVAITFDDGYEDFLTDAFPVLEKRRFPASVFLPTEYIGEHTRQFKGKRCLTWDQVRQLSKAGVHFGSHTATHPQLYSLSDMHRHEEVRQSKVEIEDRLGVAVDAFSYPFAFPQHDARFRARLRAMLEDCGYAYGVSTILGRVRPNDDRFFARRLPVNTLDDARLLRAKLEGGYDWLHGIQYMVKAFRRVTA